MFFCLSLAGYREVIVNTGKNVGETLGDVQMLRKEATDLHQQIEKKTKEAYDLADYAAKLSSFYSENGNVLRKELEKLDDFLDETWQLLVKTRKRLSDSFDYLRFLEEGEILKQWLKDMEDPDELTFALETFEFSSKQQKINKWLVCGYLFIESGQFESAKIRPLMSEVLSSYKHLCKRI